LSGPATGNPVIRTLLKKSDISGLKAEPENVGVCEFTGVQGLLSELPRSDVSGRRCRIDQTVRSAVSGKVGHTTEFTRCGLTGQVLLESEAERCDVTGTLVMSGQLASCSMSDRKVLPALLEASSVSGKKALREWFVESSISGSRFLEAEGVRSTRGHHCAPHESRPCVWGGRACHPADLRVCDLTGKQIYFEFATDQALPRLQALADLLDGTRHGLDGQESWELAARLVTEALRAKCKVVSAQASPDGRHLALCLENRAMLGLKVQHAACLYALRERAIVGRIALGKRGKTGWVGV
jgi:hypothetical protein